MARAVSKFVPLRCRTPYSILEGALKIDDLAKRCREWRIPAAGLTDTNNICAALEFSEKLTGAGIQPIMGCTLTVDIETGDEQLNPHGGKDYAGTIALLAQSEKGYENLMKLSSASFLDAGAMDLPHITLSHLQKHSEGLIVLTGGGDGFINRLICDGQLETAGEMLGRLSHWFEGRLYIELQRHNLPHEIQAEPHLIDFAYTLNLPLVATNEPYFLDKDMHKAHDALLAISEGSYILEPDRRHVSVEAHLKSPEQMIELFKDIPEAIENTIDIARRCAFRSPKRKPILPNFGDGSHSEGELLAEQARAGLEARLQKVELAKSRDAYFERLDFELNVIEQMGFPGYFLIVADFIKWAKDHDIPVGPGRGSGAGSVVAWALTITDLDPLRYGLLFERFLNPERISMPDFDIDFCQERRGEVIRYVQEKYGEDQVAHIITFGTLQARAVVRDVGRVLQMPLRQVDRLAKLVPSNPASPVSLEEAIKIEPALRKERDEEPAVAELLNMALQLEGLYRNASTHAAGVVIGDRPLTELVPLYIDPRSNIPATQFTMKWVEKAGLVKFDFLGLKTLTVIDRALKYLKQQGIDLDMDTIPVDDELSYKRLAEGLSQGVFQLESSGMRDTLRKMAPDSIEELTALISLYRPGPMKNIDSYIDRKFGREEIRYPHPSLEGILKETYGIIIYQEQVMQIAQVLSGYSLGDADILRRAMGKKDKEEMARQKSIFVDGAEARGVKGALASDIFELVNEFAGYGFNKSHAAAYAMISYRTAYLKAQHSVEFIAASMSLEIANVDKLSLFHKEAGRMGLDVVLPCVNASFADFEVKDGKIIYALGAIKNVGVEAMRHVIDVRTQGGPFKDMFDFARRVDARTVNKRAYENLARAGAFDTLEPCRSRAFAAAGILQSIGTRASQERNSAQVSLFGDTDSAMAEPELPDVADWGLVEKLDQELSAVGFYISGHPLERQLESLEKRKIVLFENLSEESARRGQVVRMAGVLHKRQERISSRTGKRFAYLNLSDPTGEYEVFVGEELLGANRERLNAGTLLELQVKLDLRDGEVRMTVNSIRALSSDGEGSAAPSFTGLNVYLRNQEALEALKRCIAGLDGAPSPQTKGKMNVIVPLDNVREVELRLPGRYALDSKFRAALKTVAGVEKISEF
ncbi:MAG: DNA polymerase III subunit alpha [Robiginitomaculum sp.]|nr:MAG: DNA polymerase III subunit alpha [Robiginitomaculum sp.]